jgi:multiphosphoryl transfer protein
MTLILQAPLAGWCMPLEEVPDPVFAERMAGDGVAIDPTGNILHAPCDGEIVPMQGAKHAMTLRSASGHEILLHLGIDTVKLDGAGFEPLVGPGQRVISGQELLRFDLDLIARRARSAVTPILLASEGIIRRRSTDCAVEIGDFLMEIEVDAGAAAGAGSSGAAQRKNPPGGESRLFSVPFEHGLHARPAALIAAALRPFAADVVIVARGQSGNARSTVALMSLGVHCGDTIEVRASGFDTARALAALETLLVPVKSPAPVATTIAPATISRAVPAKDTKELPRRLNAVIASPGISVGQAAQLTQPEIAVVEAGAGAELEDQALSGAIDKVRTHLETLVKSASGEQQSILAAHVELIQDPELARQAKEWLQRGKSAAFAWREAARATIATLNALGDSHIMQRAGDLRDLENQVLRVLGGMAPGTLRELPERAILLADELLPSQLMALDRSRIAGICSARGGPTSHVAIIAAAMGIPTLVAAGPDVLEIADGTLLVLDAEHGHLDIDPPPAQRDAVEKILTQRAAQRSADLAAAQQPCHTIDGVPITVYANLGALAEAAPAVAQGAEGCGLLRTEFLFLDRSEPPDENEQAREYQEIANALGGRPLTIRTLDIGGDKPIPYLPLPREENPALGLRGLRTSLWRPELLHTQLRAILRVQPARQCRILLPMVTDLEDVRVVRALLDEFRNEGAPGGAPTLGVMIETPASALLADQLVCEVDFLSIGTNDLSQYTLAMDRGHPELAPKLDALHPAVLRLIATAATAGHAAGKEVAVCGGLGSDLAAIPILIGLGIREVSAVPAVIPRIKGIIRSLNASACAELAREALEQNSAPAVRALAESWHARQSEGERHDQPARETAHPVTGE